MEAGKVAKQGQKRGTRYRVEEPDLERAAALVRSWSWPIAPAKAVSVIWSGTRTRSSVGDAEMQSTLSVSAVPSHRKPVKPVQPLVVSTGRGEKPVGLFGSRQSRHDWIHSSVVKVAVRLFSTNVNA